MRVFMCSVTIVRIILYTKLLSSPAAMLYLTRVETHSKTERALLSYFTRAQAHHTDTATHTTTAQHMTALQ